MKILAISGSLQARVVQHRARARGARARSGGSRGRALRRARAHPPLRPGSRSRGRRDARARRRAPAPDRGGRCAPRRHAGVQRLDHRRPQERDRLGLGPASRELAPQQDRRRRGSDDRPVRRDLGPAGPEARARNRRRPGRRRRAAGLDRAREVRREGRLVDPLRRGARCATTSQRSSTRRAAARVSSVRARRRSPNRERRGAA